MTPRSAFTFATASRVAVLCLIVATAAYAHDEHSHGVSNPPEMDMADQMSMDMPSNSNITTPSNTTVEIISSYYHHEDYHYLILSHIILMSISWIFILPLSIMLTLAQSPLGLPVQFGFLVLNALAVFFSILYNANTPNLYEGNAHHGLGWVLTWIVGVQMLLALINAYAQSGKSLSAAEGRDGGDEEHSPLNSKELYKKGPYRYSDDSGQGSSTGHSRTSSATSLPQPPTSPSAHLEETGRFSNISFAAPAAPFRSRYAFGSYLARIDSVLNTLSYRTLRILCFIENLLTRTILLLGYGCVLCGIAAYGGLFRGTEIFSGLAHWVKGSVFFWYGILTLGRWAGCFADRAWAWNALPESLRDKKWSAEFVESALLFFYGSTNVFLEHLAAWGKEWSATDLEHLAIAVLLFGGGLCGMLVESTRMRSLVNFNITRDLATRPQSNHQLTSTHHRASTFEPLQDSEVAEKAEPVTYSFSTNPLPALTIALLGLLMSSHHQASMVSTMIHAQWGMLLFIAAAARLVTYLLCYLAPPTSYLPSRPPTELISAFCFMAGGVVFCVSARDSVNALEATGLGMGAAMFQLTVAAGGCVALMAWTLVCLSVKGWASKRRVRV